ncbi:hypothetical protein AVEN_107078-1 [Araneus ventricosus]|uniref:Uncharacterized protein n=1 Tax=Araneus ventricosus TaxID=182803 RepID=A0A4Y2T0E7_ARAVE|nr:hypothetical protein AVEN_34038-1 [Araneus ventricosus]GBN93360.1 hypothetical protein AVEN_107078-1 [Araneus ventricosus]
MSSFQDSSCSEFRKPSSRYPIAVVIEVIHSTDESRPKSSTFFFLYRARVGESVSCDYKIKKKHRKRKTENFTLSFSFTSRPPYSIWVCLCRCIRTCYCRDSGGIYEDSSVNKTPIPIVFRGVASRWIL